MITYTITITELKPGNPETDTPPVVCLEHHCTPKSPTDGEIHMANQFSVGLKRTLDCIMNSMASAGFAQQVDGQGESGVAAINAVKAGFIDAAKDGFTSPYTNN